MAKRSATTKPSKATKPTKPTKPTATSRPTKTGKGTKARKSSTSARPGPKASKPLLSDVLRAGPDFELAAVDPAGTPAFKGGKSRGRRALAEGADRLSDLQERLTAAAKGGSNRSVLLVVQAMDTAGKGGIIRHVVGAVDPQGVRVAAFKAPTRAERTHDFLWRIRKRVPPAGRIGVFDRSHYEDVLVVPGSSARPARRSGSPAVRTDQPVRAGARRLDDTTIVKVMLHVSADEQKTAL